MHNVEVASNLVTSKDFSENTEAKKDLLFMATIEEMCNTTNVNNSLWFIDSGCTNHMTVDLSLFKDLDKSYMSKVRIGNEDYMKVKGKCAVEVETMSGTKSLKNVFYVPKINQNLVSIGKLIESGYSLFIMMKCATLKKKREYYCYLLRW